MIIQVSKSNLKGKVIVPPSKSMAHRAVICASLAKDDGDSDITNLSESKDIIATREAVKLIGVSGSEIYCNESGSTLRFLIPVAAAYGGKYTFTGSGRLSERPIDAYVRIFNEQNIFNETTNGGLPYTIDGKLKPGRFEIEGNVSSQYISGLLFALPLLDGNSHIDITTKLESKPYVDMTIEIQKLFGIQIEEKFEKERYSYYVKGNQKYKQSKYNVEGDYSQAAFFLCAKRLGADIEIEGLNENSIQGDRKIVEILDMIDAGDSVIDASQVPDLVPVVSIYAALSEGHNTRIVNAGRLRIKECDRLKAMFETIYELGGDIFELNDGLVIKGVKNFRGGITLNSFNDHRIAMSIAIAALRCKRKVDIIKAECVQKSYPDFWEVYRSLGGIADELYNR